MLPLIVVLAIIALVGMIASSIILALLGLIVAFVFFVVGVMLLYALHKMDALDVERNPWLIAVPPIMFFMGLGLDRTGILQFQPLSLSAFSDLSYFVSAEALLFMIVIALLIVDILVGLKR